VTIWLEWVPKGLDFGKYALGTQGLRTKPSNFKQWMDENTSKILIYSAFFHSLIFLKILVLDL